MWRIWLTYASQLFWLYMFCLLKFLYLKNTLFLLRHQLKKSSHGFDWRSNILKQRKAETQITAATQKTYITLFLPMDGRRNMYHPTSYCRVSNPLIFGGNHEDLMICAFTSWKLNSKKIAFNIRKGWRMFVRKQIIVQYSSTKGWQW